MLSQDELVVHLKKLDRKQREILKSLVKSIHLRQFIVTSLTSPQVKLENTTKNTTLINNKDKLVAAHAELIETLLTGDFKRILKDYELSNRIITAAHDAANRYYKKYESGNHTQLSYTEFEEIGDILKDCSKISQKYDHVMNLVVNNFYNLILSRANKYLLGRNSLRSDAVQEGFIGLLDGINRYDLSRGFKLSTYITHWIDMRIRRFLYSSEDLLYFKEKFITEKHKISGQIARLEQKMGKNLTITEACKILGVDQARYASLLVTTNNFSDLSDVDSLIVDSLQDSMNVEALMDKALRYEAILHAFSKLSPIQEKLLRMKYGIGQNKYKLVLNNLSDAMKKTQRPLSSILAEIMRTSKF